MSWVSMVRWVWASTILDFFERDKKCLIRQNACGYHEENVFKSYLLFIELFLEFEFPCCKLSLVLSTAATDVGLRWFPPWTQQAEDLLISGNSLFELALTQWFKVHAFLNECKNILAGILDKSKNIGGAQIFFKDLVFELRCPQSEKSGLFLMSSIAF